MFFSKQSDLIILNFFFVNGVSVNARSCLIIWFESCFVRVIINRSTFFIWFFVFWNVDLLMIVMTFTYMKICWKRILKTVDVYLIHRSLVLEQKLLLSRSWFRTHFLLCFQIIMKLTLDIRIVINWFLTKKQWTYFYHFILDYEHFCSIKIENEIYLWKT